MEEKWEKPWNFHTCKLCTYRTKSTFQMFKHETLHQTKAKINTFTCGVNPEMFACEFCDFLTDLAVDLYEHFRVIHQGKQANEEMDNILKFYGCKHCDFRAYSVLVLAKHASFCDNVFRNTPDRSKPGITNRFKCTKCPFATKRLSNLRGHVAARHGKPEDVEWFMCSDCPFTSKTKSYYKRHIVVQHGRSADLCQFQCSKCTFKIKHKCRVKQRENTTCWFKCERCSFQTMHKGQLKRHFVLKHPNSEDLKCEMCGLRTSNLRNLRFHIITKHVTPPEDVGWLKCPQCSFKTKTRPNLRSHIEVHANPDDLARYTCTKCPYRAKQKKYMTLHMLAQHDGNPNDRK